MYTVHTLAGASAAHSELGCPTSLNSQDGPPQTCPRATNPSNSSVESLLSDRLSLCQVDNLSCQGQAPSKGAAAQSRRSGKLFAETVIEGTVLKR